MTTSLQRHGFVAYFALEDAREILMRRLELLRRPKMDSKGFVICLPPTSLDPFGRPTIIIKPTKLQSDPSLELQYFLCACMEALRARLQQHNSERDSDVNSNILPCWTWNECHPVLYVRMI